MRHHTFGLSARTAVVNGRCERDHPAGEMMGPVPSFDPKSPSPSTPIPVSIGFAVSFLEGTVPLQYPFAIQLDESGLVRTAEERHYRLVSADQITESDMAGYRQRAAGK